MTMKWMRTTAALFATQEAVVVAPAFVGCAAPNQIIGVSTPTGPRFIPAPATQFCFGMIPVTAA